MTQRRSVTRWFGVLGVTVALVGLISQGTASAQTPLAETRQKADQGDATAQYNLGNIYANGEGVPQDDAQAAAGAAKAHRALVVDQPAAAPGQDGRAVGEARAVLLAPAGGESPDPTPVRGDAAADLGAARAGGLTCSERHGVGLAKNEHRQGAVCETCPRTRSIQARVAAM